MDPGNPPHHAADVGPGGCLGLGSSASKQLPQEKFNIKSFIHFLQYSERAQSCPCPVKLIISRRVFSVDTDMTIDSDVLCCAPYLMPDASLGGDLALVTGGTMGAGRNHAIIDGCENLMTQLPGQYCTDRPPPPIIRR